MAQHGGAADSYYNAGGGPPPMQYQQGQPPNGYQQPQYPPPNYGQTYQNNPPMNEGGGKQTFDQAFKLDRPKYNDLWAGILVRGEPSTVDWSESI